MGDISDIEEITANSKDIGQGYCVMFFSYMSEVLSSLVSISTQT